MNQWRSSVEQTLTCRYFLNTLGFASKPYMKATSALKKNAGFVKKRRLKYLYQDTIANYQVIREALMYVY